MDSSLPTRGQIERTLSQRIQALYRTQLGHQPGKITCQLVEEKLTILIENSLTQAEQILAEEGQTQLAAEVRTQLDQAVRPKLKMLIEEILNVSVLDLLSDATLATGRTGIIAVLAGSPDMRTSGVLRQPQ